MIYSRNKYETENLKKEDFLHGLGYDTSLLNRYFHIRRKEKIRESYYFKDSVFIDGTIGVKRDHPLLLKVLIDIEDDRILIIESIHKHWHIGYYWVIVYRVDGTKSHGTCFYKNENCIDETILEGIEETRKEKKFKDPNLNWDMF